MVEELERTLLQDDNCRAQGTKPFQFRLRPGVKASPPKTSLCVLGVGRKRTTVLGNDRENDIYHGSPKTPKNSRGFFVVGFLFLWA